MGSKQKYFCYIFEIFFKFLHCIFFAKDTHFLNHVK
ncbi:hypothetical protein LCGC14_1949600, partial [marine sediment metagenome]